MRCQKCHLCTRGYERKAQALTLPCPYGPKGHVIIRPGKIATYPQRAFEWLNQANVSEESPTQPEPSQPKPDLARHRCAHCNSANISQDDELCATLDDLHDLPTQELLSMLRLHEPTHPTHPH